MVEVETKNIELPVKLIFSDSGVDFFIKNKRPMSKFRMADNSTQYGISMNQYSQSTIKHMISIGYLSRIEISRADFSSKRRDLLALATNNVFGFLVKRFDEMVFNTVMDSELIKNWNRANHGSILDRKTNINDVALKQILDKNKDIVSSVKESLAFAANKDLAADNSLSEEEKDDQGKLCYEYLNGIRSLTWFVLSKFKDAHNYDILIQDITVILREFMSRNKIAEFLSLMLMELLNSSENRNLQEYIKFKHPTLSYNDVLEDPEARVALLKEMQDNGEHFTLSFKFDKSETKVSAKKRFEVAVFNKETELMMIKDKVDEQMSQRVRKSSLTDFYRSGGNGSDLGMFYLSYLSEECSKVGIKFESQVKEMSGSSLSYITLGLTL